MAKIFFIDTLNASLFLEGTLNGDLIEITHVSFAADVIKAQTVFPFPTTFSTTGGKITPTTVINPNIDDTSDAFRFTADFEFELPAQLIESMDSTPLPVDLSWKKLRVDLQIPDPNDPTKNELKLTLTHLKISSTQLPGIVLDCDLHFAYTGDAFVPEKSLIQRYQPDAQHRVPLSVKDIHFDSQLLGLKWSDPDVNYWMNLFAAGFKDVGSPLEMLTTFQILFEPSPEIRLEWQLNNQRRTYRLPGLNISSPQTGQNLLTLLLQKAGETFSNAAFVLSQISGAAFKAASNFAWQRAADRELQNDDERPDTAPPLFEISPTSKKSVSVVLMSFKRGKTDLPVFLKQFSDPISPVDFANPAPAPTSSSSFKTTDWQKNLGLTIHPLNFKFPFLRIGSGSGTFDQMIRVTSLEPVAPEDYDFSNHAVGVTLNTAIQVGQLDFQKAWQVLFDWEKFAFSVDHDQGIDLISANPTLPEMAHMGLNWRFKGALITAGVNSGKFHFFKLVTKDYNYQLKLAKGAVLELDFTKASVEPITFRSTNFVVTAKGINLTADVLDNPARLNGINTRYRFHSTQMEIIENNIQDFTLSGTGPLPPDLVGDAMADISLQFKQQTGGKLALVAGAAQLKDTNMLDSKNTRFQFQVDSLGLDFVDDGRYHLFFKISGNANYVPAIFDDSNGPLALLSSITIQLVECPLTGDASVIARHIGFLIELPEPLVFSFLGCFTFELRAIGFLAFTTQFDGDPAMQLSGQVMFAKGGQDTHTAKIDFHGLYIGIPKKGSLFPRLHLQNLAVEIKYGDAFQLSGSVSFFDNELQKGFIGEGQLQIKGLPTIAAAFGFVRARLDENSNWLRAWFIYLEVRKVSFPIPRLEIYLREVGLGFGYRYTISAIKQADEENDIGKLVRALKESSRTIGDLAKVENWALDLEKRGEDLRWSIVLRAMFSQSSASVSPLRYNEAAEKFLPCAYLFDAIIAFRSDLTFFMAVRGWLNTNYNDFFENTADVREHPIVSGFILFSPHQKRLLAHVSSNPDGSLGTRPVLPELARKAILTSDFSATLLIEPGLFHLELGWPNLLRFRQFFGPVVLEMRMGFIFRVSETEIVFGISLEARATLEISAGFEAVVIGASIYALAHAAIGARLVAMSSLVRDNDFAVYGAIGIEMRIEFRLIIWIGIKIGFLKITLDFKLSFSLGFTAGLEFGLTGPDPGVRGTGTVWASFMGHRLSFKAKFSSNEPAVIDALGKVKPFLNIGLDAEDIEGTPGIDPGTQQPRTAASNRPSSLRATPTSPTLRGPTTSRFTAAGDADAARFTDRAFGAITAQPVIFHAPDYTLFVINKPAANGKTHSYFVLLPKGEGEQGFLPAPPAAGVSVENDFLFKAPASDKTFLLERFNPFTGIFETEDNLDDISWKVNWDATVFSAENFGDGGPGITEPTTEQVKLADYLTGAFILDRNNQPIGDPELITKTQAVVDERVQNPTDNAFEAAVRGAVEQFRGSPYFKKDYNNEYEQALGIAFDDDTTIYSPDGKITPESEAIEQADHVRSMIIHDLIADFREYIAAISEETPDDAAIKTLTDASIAFQMGLVFRVEADAVERPEWLDFSQKYLDDHNLPYPTIRQRINTTSPSPDSNPEKPATTFNIAAANFANFSPQFQNVRQYTSTNTIAITWDLVWEDLPEQGCSDCQAEPEHHLLHYQVRRRALDGSEPEQVYTVKNADTVHVDKDQNGQPILKNLKPRFQVVDHFNRETQEEQAALPASGRSYLYTITPSDVAGNLGRPLTVVATRFPSEPPLVPTNGELTIGYRMSPDILSPSLALQNSGELFTPDTVTPTSVQVNWREPSSRDERPMVPIKTYRLIFRKDTTLPVGSYGLDGATHGPRSKSLPTSNARPLPTDIKINLEPDGSREARHADISVETLRDAGVIPKADNPKWRPEAWRVFFQTVSVNDVPSALVPVNLLLRVEGQNPDSKKEERRPAQLEWIPEPLQFPLLPPEDMRAVAGLAHVPMPASGNFTFSGANGAAILNHIEFRKHPDEVRCIRFRWNQGPSSQPDYPLILNAGYHLLELNIDAHTDDTFDDKERLAKALRTIQEVQMLPADELLLAPGDTLTTSQWESWYPATLQRLRDPEKRLPGSETPYGPWFSWRESYLVWPNWPGFTDSTAERPAALHPALQKFVDVLRNDPDGTLGATYIVDLQITPPIQEGEFSDLLKNTDPGPDPYGWGILQRFGLAVALSLREASTGEIITGVNLLDALHKAYQNYKNDIIVEGRSETLAAFAGHLNVELLFQPAQTISLETGGTPKDGSMLGIIQLTLRPTVQQDLKYAKVQISGQPGENLELTFSNIPADGCLLIDQSNLSKGEIELKPPATGNGLEFVVTLPVNGQTTLLLRSRSAFPKIEQIQSNGTVEFPKTIFAPTDELATYFSVPVDGLAEAFARNPVNDPLAKQWRIFKKYAESINSNLSDPPPAKIISIPTDVAGIENILPDYLGWTIRFFDHGGAMNLSPAMSKKSTGAGPWLATAYPRSGNPVYASPDAGGRLKYDHLLEDRYAHNLRYYIRPYSRYDLLWQSFRQSPALFPDPKVDEIIADLNDLKLSELLRKTFENNDISLLTSAQITRQDRHHWSISNNGNIYNIEQLSDDLQVTENDAALFTLEKNFKLLREVTPDPQKGALDVVLDRTKPVAKPVVLRSGRLDEAGGPGKPAAPGKTWEVIVAQHPEQALIERNQQLFRQLSFRQVAFTLLRRFGFSDWLNTLQSLPGVSPIQIQYVENQFPEIPQAFPETPDHVDLAAGDIVRKLEAGEISPNLRTIFEQNDIVLSATPAISAANPGEWKIIESTNEYLIKKSHRTLSVSADNREIFRFADMAVSDASTARSLDLPRRIGNFQQGAMALQWEALPYFYEHRLLLIAQTTTTVSPINEVIQRDFEYQSPTPEAISESKADPVSAVRFRQVDIPLKRFWDCLPKPAQDQWIHEKPDPNVFDIGLEFAPALDSEQISPELRSEFTAHEFPLSADAAVQQKIAGERWEIHENGDLRYIILRDGNRIYIYNQTGGRKYASLPDPEVVYQIVELFSGNIEVQAEFFFDDALTIFTRRQLGENFIADPPTLKSPESDKPQDNFFLRFQLHQFSRAGLNRAYAIPPGFQHLLFEGNTLLVDGVFADRDRDLFVTLLGSENGFISRSMSEGPMLGTLPAALLAKLDYPELPRGDDLPAQLEQQIIIDAITDDAARLMTLRWNGAMSPTQADALRNYHPELPVFQNSVNALVAKMAAQTFVAAYQPGNLRQNPAALEFPADLSIDVIYPPAANAGWQLRWNGGITTVEEQQLRNLQLDLNFNNTVRQLIDDIKDVFFEVIVSPGVLLVSPIPNFTITNFGVVRRLRWTQPNPDQEAAIRALIDPAIDPFFHQGVDQLVAQLNNYYQNKTFTTNIIDDPFLYPTRPQPGSNWLPAPLEIAIVLPPDPSPHWALNWTGTLSAGQESALRNLDGDLPFRDAIVALIDKIKADPNITPATVTVVEIPGVYFNQGIDLEFLQQQIKYEFLSLVIDAENKKITWTGADHLTVSPKALIARLQSCLVADDPFLLALTAVLNQIDAAEFAEPFSLPRKLAIKAPFNQDDLLALSGEFPKQQDRTKLQSLYADLQDQQSLENLYKGWDSQAAVSQPLINLPSGLAELVDFPQPTDCVLTWQGTLSQPERDAILALAGDAPFKEALRRLADAAANASEADVTRIAAPLGLDQPPKIIAESGKLALSIDATAAPVYTRLTWAGHMFDAEADALQQWAQLPEFLTVVKNLLAQLDARTITKTISVEIPVILHERLWINPGRVSWIGAAPSADEQVALQSIVDDTTRDAAFRTAVADLMTNAGNDCVAEIEVAGLNRRPTQADLPEIISTQLSITDSQITWNGRFTSDTQVQALAGLNGDTPFNTAIAEIIAEAGVSISIDFSLPVRPAQSDLDSILKDKLMIGKAQIRYHGLMTVIEGRTLQDAFTAPVDKAAIQRLYRQSTGNGLQGRELTVRARRGSATPSDLLPLKTRKL